MRKRKPRDPVLLAYDRVKEEEVRAARLKHLISEAEAQGKDDTQLRAFAEIVIQKVADPRQVADMLASNKKQ